MFDLTEELRPRFFTGYNPTPFQDHPERAPYAHLKGISAAGQPAAGWVTACQVAGSVTVCQAAGRVTVCQAAAGSSVTGRYSVPAAQPAAQFTQPGWGCRSQSNQL